jgi:hypothetical protein
MSVVSKFIFPDAARQDSLDDEWQQTTLKIVKTQSALVVCRCPRWTLLLFSLPGCVLQIEVDLSPMVTISFDCMLIRSYEMTAVILFAKKAPNEKDCKLVTLDVDGCESTVRTCHQCENVADVALFTDPEEIYIMKKEGGVVIFDCLSNLESLVIPHPDDPLPELVLGGADQVDERQKWTDYQLFVSRGERVCVMQASTEVARYITVYRYDNREKLFTVNLDLCRYGLSRDDCLCISTNGAFLTAADSKQFALFSVKTGNFLGSIPIPAHLERGKGVSESSALFEQTGLRQCGFDESVIVAVHDSDRTYPAVVDLYRFC